MCNMEDSYISSIWGWRGVKWVSLEAEGVSGGVVILWNSDVVELIESLKGGWTVSCLFKNIEDGFIWSFSRIYGPMEDSSRWELWEELAGVSRVWDVPVCMGGFQCGAVLWGEKLWW